MVGKLYESQAWLRLRYTMDKKSIPEMAEEAKCSVMTIRRALEKAQLIRK